MSISLQKFIHQQNENMNTIDSKNAEYLKRMIKSALQYYQFKSFEELECLDDGMSAFLYIHSMAEENLLNKLVSIASNSDLTVEAIYDGKIIRKY